MSANWVRTIVLSLAFLPLQGGCAQRPTPQQAADVLREELRNVEAFELYFVRRTESWDYTEAQIAQQASVKLYRKCGGNCHNQMKPLIEHLRSAEAVPCLRGQQSGLMKAGPVRVVYSHSGTHIKIGDNCFDSRLDVRNVVRDSNMIFN